VVHFFHDALKKRPKQNKMSRWTILFLCFVIFLFASCKKIDLGPGEVKTNCRTGVSHRKVLFIGLDGCRTDALLAAGSPAFNSLMEQGYVNLHCDRGPYTESAPGWSTLLHGVYPEKHGVTTNDLTNLNYRNYFDLFFYMRQFNPGFSLAEVSNWDDFLRLTTSEDYALRVTSDAEVRTKALFLLTHCVPDVLLLHFDAIDEAGHSSGFTPLNPHYMFAIRQTGVYVSEIMELIHAREQTYGEEWMVMVVTDHGGSGRGHYGQNQVEATRYVFEITRLPNLSRRDVEASNADIMPTILRYMNVPIHSSWDLDGNPLFGNKPER
jgi:predicted AlkP superfamily pyrophosphatase or phosphodiesterase